MGVDVEVVVDEAAEVNGLMAMIFLPPEPNIKWKTINRDSKNE